MKHSLPLAIVLMALAACSSDPMAPGAVPNASPVAARTTSAALSPAQGRYIVLLKHGTDAHREASRLVAQEHGRLHREYASGVIHGFAADLDDTAAIALQRDAQVAAVLPDVPMHAATSGVESSAPWGLDRLDQAALPLGGTYVYGADGAGVTVYIVDTGINYTHVDFAGRATPGYDAVTTGGGAVDCAGHGTHVAGTVGGATYGVAKGASLVGVRVLDCSGNGSSSGVIAGLDWVLQQKQANPSKPMVVNMSLGGGAYAPLDSAVTRLVNAGVTVVVAAGNSTVDACTSSPARTPSAITVAASDNGDRFATFSNFGTCVDVVAPGVSITSTYIGSTTATTVMSGTSMATPHTAGAAALYLSTNPSATPAQVATALTQGATPNVVTGAPNGTPNRLLYTGFIGAVAPANRAPTASISAPASGATFTPGSSVTLTGSATDPEDGALGGASLVWTSSINGRIGTGASLSTTTLSAGTHTITLTATDSKGATGTATRTITIAAVVTPPPSGVFAVTPATSTIRVGQSATLTAGGGTVPSGAMIYWRSSDATVATVGTWTGVVTALKPGTVTIYATAQVSPYPTATAKVTVVP